jgi:small basic protein
MKRHIDKLIQALVFVRLGQQLGTDSQIAQAVANGIDFAISIARNLLS